MVFFMWSALSFCAAKVSKPSRKLCLYGLGALMLLVSSPYLLPNRIFEGKSPGRLLERHAALVDAHTTLVSDEYLVHALCWFYRRNNVYLLERTGELSYGIRHDNSETGCLLTLKDFGGMVNTGRGKGGVVLVVEADRYDRYEALLPEPGFVDRENGFVFVSY